MNKKIIIGFLAAIAVIMILTLSGVFTPTGSIINAENNEVIQVREFVIDAERWEYTPNEIEVRRGEKVRISINNIDTLHGIRIPGFNAAGENFVEFTADKAGEFEFYCNFYCGEGHSEMKGKIIVK